MILISDLFHIINGQGLELLECTLCSEGGIAFVSRTSCNNGIVAFVEPIKDVAPLPRHAITVALGGSVLSCFYQPKEFYTAYHVASLYPKIDMTIEEMIAYCCVIECNKYRYNYGRQANKTIRNLKIPDIDTVRHELKQSPLLHNIFESTPLLLELEPDLSNVPWQWFRYDEIFDIKKGFYNKKPEESGFGTIPFIGATDSNNGITSMHTMQEIELASKTGNTPNQDIEEKIFKGNCITVSNNGSIGYAFYQEKDFTCSHDVNPLYLRGQTMTKYIAMFLCTLIELEQYRWAYGRKWRPKRMPSSLIKLPITKEGNPDWQFMENYIKSLPYSANI